MNRIVVLSAFFVLTFACSAFAQQPTPTPSLHEDDVVKITTSLIQVDAVVKKKDGTPVSDLKRENFQVFQDDKPQKITSVTYIDPRSNSQGSSITKGDKNHPDVPASGLRTSQGRIITFVLDDGNCYSTMEGNSTMRDAMKRFIDQQMQPDDRVAVYRTKGGSSLLQMYTSNKDVLRQKISKLSLLSPGGCGSANEANTLKPPPNSVTSPILSSNPGGDARDLQRDEQTVASLKVLDVVIDRLQGIGQRKEIFLFSEGISAGKAGLARDTLLELADKATRASIIIHAVSNKGLDVPMLGAADNVESGGTDAALQKRMDEERSLGSGLAYLAYTTGGQFVQNKNFPDKEIGKILSSESGYYLIAYEPESDTFNGKEFHKIDIKVDRPELTVTSRRGFFGREDEAKKVINKTADSPLYRAITSPLVENSIDLRLTVQFLDNAKAGGFVRGMLHVKGDDIQFKDEPDGKKKFVMDVIVVLLDENAKAISDINKTYTLHLNPDSLPNILKNGIDFAMDVPVKGSGLYSYRIAVRDAASGRMGAAGDFIDVPDLKKGKFFLSGLTATNFNNDRQANLPDYTTEGDFTVASTKATAASREYKHGESVVFTYSIFNAKNNGDSPSLTREIRLFKDGKMLLDSVETPMTPIASGIPSLLTDQGSIRISDQVQPGEYELQIIVRDKVANKVANQAVDFEVSAD